LEQIFGAVGANFGAVGANFGVVGANFGAVGANFGAVGAVGAVGANVFVTVTSKNNATTRSIK
jgi:hypothetical protein